MKKIKSYHRQKKFKWQILHVCVLMGLLLVMLSSMGDAQAYDWPIEGQDSIFAMAVFSRRRRPKRITGRMILRKMH
ncbi:hypothetical protein DXA98_08750 [Lachnospiraceae bacterium OF09-6]|nr:hypothetical protein DXA98_08750 [Lachnospiraceae bacterium OF09-6]